MNEKAWNLRLAAETGNRNRQQSSERINLRQKWQTVAEITNE